MKCLRRVFRVPIRDRIWNEDIRRRVVVLSDQSGGVEKCVQRWFGHVECIDGERMAKRI